MRQWSIVYGVLVYNSQFDFSKLPCSMLHLDGKYDARSNVLAREYCQCGGRVRCSDTMPPASNTSNSLAPSPSEA